MAAVQWTPQNKGRETNMNHPTQALMVAWLVLGASAHVAHAQATPDFVDIPYALQHARQVLDIYLPTTGSGPFPVVILDSWRSLAGRQQSKCRPLCRTTAA